MAEAPTESSKNFLYVPIAIRLMETAPYHFIANRNVPYWRSNAE